jgi:hypothetical protein
MAKSRMNNTNVNKTIVGGIFVGFAAIAVIGFICIVLFALGYYLIKKYNKPGTKLFKEIQPMQYLGMFLCFLALLPFIQYFFMGFLFSAGEAAFSSMFE